jgi:hypothetical protein
MLEQAISYLHKAPPFFIILFPALLAKSNDILTLCLITKQRLEFSYFARKDYLNHITLQKATNINAIYIFTMSLRALKGCGNLLR